MHCFSVIRPAVSKITISPEHIDQGLIPDIGYLVFRKCTPLWKIKQKLRVFNYWDLTYVIRGRARYTIDGDDYDLQAGDLLCFPPGHSREARTWPDNPMHCFSVNFSLNDLRGRPARLPFPLVSHIGEHEDIIHLFHELVFTWVDRQPLYLIKCRALFLLILHRLFELCINTDSAVMDYRISKIISHMAKHYAEKLSVRKMAEILGLNTVYFGALFKRETGMTMKRYLNHIRIKNAENMLRSGEYKVGEVAEHCGYTDIFHFYKQFKQFYGFAPSECIPKKNKY
jgi:AraC-like DNA-binding protein